MASLFFPIIVTGILSVLTSVHIVQGGLMESIVKCCSEGRSLATKSTCEDILHIMSSVQVLQRSRPVCNFIGIVCCENALRDEECASGVKAALSSEPCDSAESDDFKKCCEVCKSGLKVGKEDGRSCELRETTLGPLYDPVLVQCCLDAKSTNGKSEGNQTQVVWPKNACSLNTAVLCTHICIPTGHSFRCACRPGYTLLSDGASCSPTSIRSCQGCSHSCEERPTGKVCTCPAGWTLGADNITCTVGKDTTTPLNCARGYRPKTNQTSYCEDIDECTEGISTCNSTSERCVNTIGSYSCVGQCKRGFKYNEHRRICEDIDECTKGISTCNSTSQRCVNTIGSYNCQCKRGFQYNKHRRNCEDIDECTEGISTCNSTSERCVNTIGSYNCPCKRGFKYNEHRRICEDINECNDIEDPPCDSSQRCENTVGGHICHCRQGFKEEPVTLACVDVNECQQMLHNCGQFQRCDNTMGSYVCVRDINCGTGYTLNSQTGKCEDDDECMLGTNTCTNMGSGWECKNTQGSFRCVKKQNTTKAPCTGSTCSPLTRPCPSGFRASGNSCVDINECEEGISRCTPDQRCVNIQGYYLCSNILNCKTGFRLNEDKSHCKDINECDEQEDLCMHICENRWGSFRCTCNLGFELAPDNRTCLDVNECELGRRCQGYCVNEQGSYRCQCPPGYTLGDDDHTCLDIDECTNSPDVCQSDTEECVNIPGSYRCSSVECPAGYEVDPNRRSRCIKNVFCPTWDDEECLQQPAIFSYNFISMISNYSVPKNDPVNLFVVESVLGATTPNFSLELRQARVPPGVEAATRSNFNLHKHYGRAVVQLVKPLFGPQDILLELKTDFFSKKVFRGSSLHNIEIYVSQYAF